MKIVYPEIETLPISEIKSYQINKINTILSQVSNTPYYKGKLPKRVSSFADFEEIPFLTKNDLRNAFPYGLLSIPHKNLVRINASSGTTGIPTLSYCSKDDLRTFAENEVIHLSHAGIRANDIIQCMIGFNLFTAGWICYHGAIELGACVIPTGPGNTQRQINLLKQLKAEYTYSTPGYLQYLLESISEEDWKDIHLKKALTAGEVLTKEFQNLAKNKYNIEVYNFYGMTEFATEIASECYLHDGLHVNELYVYPEIIDPKTCKLLPDGEYGELVLTNLCREAMPLIRYRTNDYTRIIPEPCRCGRTHRRIEAISHRIDDMIIINGVNIYPSQIEECIYKNLYNATNYLIHVYENKGIKQVTIDIELKDSMLNDKENLVKFEMDLIKSLKSYITITPKLNFVPLNTFPEVTGKSKKVVFENK